MDDRARSAGRKYAFRKWAQANRKHGSFSYNYDNIDGQLRTLYFDSPDELVKLLGGDDVAADYYCGTNERHAVDPCVYCHAALKQAGDELCAGCRLWADSAEEWEKLVADNVYQLVTAGHESMIQRATERAQKLIDEKDREADKKLADLAESAQSSHARHIRVKTPEELEQEAERHADDYDTWAQSCDTSADDIANSRFQL